MYCRLDLWFDDCAVQTKTGKIICKDTKINSKGSSTPSLQNDVKALVTSSDTRYWLVLFQFFGTRTKCHF